VSIDPVRPARFAVSIGSTVRLLLLRRPTLFFGLCLQLLSQRIAQDSLGSP